MADVATHAAFVNVVNNLLTALRLARQEMCDPGFAARSGKNVLAEIEAAIVLADLQTIAPPPAEPVRPGFVMLPAEATDAMCAAAQALWERTDDRPTGSRWRDIYCAMVEAAWLHGRERDGQKPTNAGTGDSAQ